MKMVEIDIHAILRKQKKKPPDKPVEIDYFWEAGNIIKYVSRAGRKGDYIEDLLKARAYLDKAIDLEHGRRTQCSSSDV